MPPRRTITASFPPSLFEQVEQARGLVSRSAWLQRAAEEFLVGRGASGPAPVERAFDALARGMRKPIEGQTTVDEMLASCPQCAGELRNSMGGQTATVACVDCGWVRGPAG